MAVVAETGAEYWHMRIALTVRRRDRRIETVPDNLGSISTSIVNPCT